MLTCTCFLIITSCWANVCAEAWKNPSQCEILTLTVIYAPTIYSVVNFPELKWVFFFFPLLQLVV